MKKGVSSQSGQATTEMIFMLLGFAILLLGLIFTMSLEIFNTRTLLDSKYETDRLASYSNSAFHGANSKEIKGWDYDNGIPFTLNDNPIYHSSGEMTKAHFDLGTNVDSNGKNYAYEWVRLKEFPNGKFNADYKGRDQNSIDAANLVTRKGDPEGRLLTARLPELVTAFARLVGVKIDYDNLRNNPSNRVFLPANGEL